MDLNYSAEVDAFRPEERGWFGANPPIDIQAKVRHCRRVNRADIVRRRKLMSTRGSAAPDWPVEYGCACWTPAQKDNVDDKCARAVRSANARDGKAARNFVQFATKLIDGTGVTDEVAIGNFCKRLIMIESCLGDRDPAAFAALAQAK